jgi:hypothetical protein
MGFVVHSADYRRPETVAVSDRLSMTSSVDILKRTLPAWRRRAPRAASAGRRKKLDPAKRREIAESASPVASPAPRWRSFKTSARRPCCASSPRT